jgi:RNA polymerase sigma factor (sigma-70 family)
MQATVLHINQDMHSEDAQLLAEFMQESSREVAFNAIVAKYKERLYWHIRRMVVQHDDADDVLQETFIKMWKYLPQFRQDSSLYTWLYRIATNNCLTFLDNKAKRNQRQVLTDTTAMASNISTQPGYDAKKIEWQLQLAIATLPDKQRVVFNMRYYDDMPYEQMSQVLETSEGALKASYHHAVKKIQEFLKNQAS